MKKITFFLMAVLVSAAMSGQVFVGGSLGFSTSGSSETSGNTTVDGPTNTSLSINPMIGYYLNSQMAVGAELGLVFTSENNNATPTATKISGTYFSIRPFLRYHLVEMGPISVFGQGSLGIAFGKSKIKTGNVTNDGAKTTALEIAVKPGISYKLTDQIAIEAFIGALSYSSTTVKQPNDDKEKSHELGLNLSSALNLGFVYKF
ncbi:MAG: porin family protein [Bacteroidales bacterium]|nr:porin family protein [Bacteroidales bacterium]